ncbi:MAG: alkyl sulfatase dimerization domain-containing protein [Promethearchaeota archaeon]
MESEKNKNEERNISSIKVLGQKEVVFNEPIKGVHCAIQIISGCAWIETTDGIVLIDTLLTVDAAKKVLEKIKGNIKYIIYTHGHQDHVGGARAFLSHEPEIIANKYLVDRLDKYKMMAPHRARISAQQFSIPEQPVIYNYVYPTKTFLGEMKFKLGDKTFELYTERAETDDACWVYVPELEAAFVGDLLIGSFPNIGNPWKPTRFALDWAKALERVRSKNPKYIFYKGAGNYYKGKKALKALDHTIEAIKILHDQVMDLINKDVHITEMIHQIKLPEHLEKSPFLQQRYSRPEFFVYNVYRWYHGYFDGNPAHLLPRPEKEVMKEIYSLIGDPRKILERARFLHEQGQIQLALQILDVLIQAVPDHLEARKLRIEFLKQLRKGDYCLMSSNTWVYFMNKDKEFIEKHSS